ncbi:isopentenyl-diphosphate Delta-isomerase [Parapedobacter sp. ISTM3]|nr:MULTISPECIES: isopentenyl-diphosphate Delta-isomerase [Parapedobacter]MBK1440571.1 isopentenyl-diphosphate Delta-isomerase [Parapedobacter sp. ISTM3]
MKTENVILVDEYDHELGVMEKLQAHQQGMLHRAISVFVFDKEGRLLLQQRAAHKYHSANLWTNTCCSHPNPGEAASAAAHRRLHEEMGLKTPLTFAFTFVYRAAFDNGLVEHEFDHVFIGQAAGLHPTPNPDEVATYRWASAAEIEHELHTHPEVYTEWFKLIYKRVFELAKQI